MFQFPIILLCCLPLSPAGGGRPNPDEDDDLADELLVGFEEGVSWHEINHSIRLLDRIY